MYIDHLHTSSRGGYISHTWMLLLYLHSIIKFAKFEYRKYINNTFFSINYHVFHQLFGSHVRDDGKVTYYFETNKYILQFSVFCFYH